MNTFSRCAVSLLVLCPLLFSSVVQAMEPPTTSAKSFVLVDAASGRVLLEKDAYTKRSIASTTKLMTAYTALQSASLNKTATVSKEHLKEGSSMYLAAGEKLTLEALLYGLLLPSGNDAAECIADHCGGGREDFLTQMNAAAAELGMLRTSFQNPSGLDEMNHHSSAYDMALLAIRVMEEPDLLRLASTQRVQIGARQMENHNKLLATLDGCIGFKTGYTSGAGRTLVSGCEREGVRLVAVTLDDPADWADHEALYSYGFSNYAWKDIFRRGEILARVPLRGGAMGSVKVAVAADVIVPLAAGESYEIDCVLPEELSAPLQKGTAVGKLVVSVEGKEIFSAALLCAENAEEAASTETKGIISYILGKIF